MDLPKHAAMQPALNWQQIPKPAADHVGAHDADAELLNEDLLVGHLMENAENECQAIGIETCMIYIAIPASILVWVIIFFVFKLSLF